MKRIITMALGAAGLTALAVGGLAIAGPPAGGHHGPPGIEGQILSLVRDLDLTEDQKAVLIEIREANRDEMEALRAEREGNLQVVKEQLLSDAPDAALLHALIDERAAEMQSRAHDRLDTVLEVQAILTPDQRTQIAQKLDEARERHSERRERFRDGESPRRGDGPRFGE